MESRPPKGGARERTVASGMRGNGGRALTQSERKWLTEQMASQRRRPTPSGNAAEAAPDPARNVTPAPTASEPAPRAHPEPPALEDQPREPNRGSTAGREPQGKAPAKAPGDWNDSFWSFG